MRWVPGVILVAAACGSHGSGAQGTDAPMHLDGADHDAAVDADLGAPTDVPVVPCTGSAADVYAATAQANAALGTILACSPSTVLDAATVQSDVGSGMTTTSQVSQFVVAYQTRDGDGNPAVSTARVYLPHTPLARPVPIVVAGHGTEGLAAMCAPSLSTDDSLPLPFAGVGLPTIAPDFAGLGNAGTQDYENNRAQGWQLLDGARALRALLAPGVTAEQVILAGYSQGGGAVLSAQSLVGADGPGFGKLVATVAYAPEWPISLSSFDYLGMLDDPTELTITAGLSYSSVAVLRQYAWFENHVGVGTGSQSVPTQFQATIDGAVEDNCLVAFGAYVQIEMLHTSDLINPTLSSGLLACIAAEGPADGCTGNALAYYNFLVDNTLAADPTQGPVLLVQGLDDLIMPAAQNASCVSAKLTSSGVDTSACVFSSADHTDIMDQHPTGVTWALAMLAGSAAPACPETTALPACN
jgi:hypothetical protein